MNSTFAFQTIINQDFEKGEFVLLNPEKQPIIRLTTEKNMNLHDLRDLTSKKIAIEKEKIFSVRFLN